MPFLENDDNLTITQEGSSSRARVGGKNYLFRDREPDQVRIEYKESIDFVRRFFRDKWVLASDDLEESEFIDLTLEIALHHMYFYIVNGLKVEVTREDLAHPQTKNIVWNFTRRKYGKDALKIRRVASKLLDLSVADFDRWLKRWMVYLDK
ncbi:MAG: hypothetical protein HKM93_17150 [Desulfobacteraceae bacterium]|nr:hypothetical protein [Desulfobacteraceae bacterium]